MTEDRFKEYYAGPEPKIEETHDLGLQQCDINCVKCGDRLGYLIVSIKNYPAGIDGVVDFLEKAKAGNLCESCHKKLGLVVARLKSK